MARAYGVTRAPAQARPRWLALLAAASSVAVSGCSTIPAGNVYDAFTPKTATSPDAACRIPAFTELDKHIATVLAAFRQSADTSRQATISLPIIKHATEVLEDAATLQPQSGHKLDLSDIEKFADEFHARLQLGLLSIDADVKGDEKVTAEELSLFNTVLVTYFTAYFDGKYVDRYGNNLPAPAVSQTIGDAAIAGSVSVLFDVIADYTLRTPLWVDKAGKFYPATSNASAASDAGRQPADTPGSIATPPKAPPAAAAPAATAAAAKPPAASNTPAPPTLSTLPATPGDPKREKGNVLVDFVPLADDGTTCGIDAYKAKAIEVLALAAGQSGSLVSGSFGGSFGGFGVSIGAFGKFSVGDNQTVITVTRAVVSKTAERAAEAAVYRAAYGMEDKGDTLVKLIADLLKLASAKKSS